MMARQKVTTVVLLFVLATPPPARTETFTTADVVSRSVSKNCLDWQVIGTCFWLKCSPKCRIRTTPKVQHNLPDLTVAVYPYATPWLEMRRPDLPVFTGGDPGRESRRSTTVRFKEVDVIGNPAARFRNTFSVPFLCRSKTEPLKLYFSSKKGQPRSCGEARATSQKPKAGLRASAKLVIGQRTPGGQSIPGSVIWHRPKIRRPAR